MNFLSHGFTGKAFAKFKLREGECNFSFVGHFLVATFVGFGILCAHSYHGNIGIDHKVFALFQVFVLGNDSIDFCFDQLGGCVGFVNGRSLRIFDVNKNLLRLIVREKFHLGGG